MLAINQKYHVLTMFAVRAACGDQVVGSAGYPPRPTAFSNHPCLQEKKHPVITLSEASEAYADHFVCKFGGGAATPPAPPRPPAFVAICACNKKKHHVMTMFAVRGKSCANHDTYMGGAYEDRDSDPNNPCDRCHFSNSKSIRGSKRDDSFEDRGTNPHNPDDC